MPEYLNTMYHVIPPQENNKVVFSCLTSAELPVMQAPAVGFKFVLEGEESYAMNNRLYKVKPQQFLLVNAFEQYNATITGKQAAIGLCIDINDQVMGNAYWAATHTTDVLLDNGCSFPTVFPLFFEQVYCAGDIAAGSGLSLLTSRLKNGCTPTGIDPAFFYQLAWDILLLNEAVRKKIITIRSKKPSTKAELYRRVLHAKTLLDDCVPNDLSLDKLAAEASLSKFHLLRVFKQAFGISPHQYQIQKKMEYAVQLLKDKSKSIEAITLALNFTDAPTFCKCFKRMYGCTPGQYRGRVM